MSATRLSRFGAFAKGRAERSDFPQGLFLASAAAKVPVNRAGAGMTSENPAKQGTLKLLAAAFTSRKTGVMLVLGMAGIALIRIHHG